MREAEWGLIATGEGQIRTGHSSKQKDGLTAALPYSLFAQSAQFLDLPASRFLAIHGIMPRSVPRLSLRLQLVQIYCTRNT